MLPPLTEIQSQALDLLSGGAPVGHIAQALGIHRQTLWRWRQEPQFGAAWDAERARAADQMRQRFETLTAAALQVIEQELVSEPTYYARARQLPVALAFLRLVTPQLLLSTPPGNG